MKKLLRIFALTLSVITLCAVLSVPASAVTFDCKATTYSDSIYMVNLDTGMEVYSKDADTKRYPASLTKIMTYIIVAEYYDDFDGTKIDIKQSIIDKVLNSGMSTSGMDWYVGEKLSVTQLLYGMMVPQGHDAAMILADAVSSGDEKAFVEMMNQKAQELGCENTHFTNCTGVHNPDHYTTARDMATITTYAMSLPMFSKICGTSTYYVKKDDDIPLVTTNYLIDPGRGGDYFYTYATGIKNGTTDEAGRCLAASAVYDGYAYLVISLHAPYNEEKEQTDQYCMIEAADLFRWAFLNLTFVTPATRSTPVCEQKVDHAWDTESILLVPENDLNIVLPDNYSDGDVTITPDNTDSVSAPITKGDVITTATVSYKGEAFTKINLVASDNVAVSPILYVTDAIRTVLTSPWFLISVALVVVLFIIYVSVSTSYAKKKRKNRR